MKLGSYIFLAVLLVLPSAGALADSSKLKPKSEPAALSTPKKLTAEEEEKREWIARWCRRAKKDPKCKFYVEKELGKAMREVSKQDHAMGLDEYCLVHKDDFQCVARRERNEIAERARKMKELISFCRANPDAPRCEAGLDGEGEGIPDPEPPKKKKKSSD